MALRFGEMVVIHTKCHLILSVLATITRVCAERLRAKSVWSVNGNGEFSH